MELSRLSSSFFVDGGAPSPVIWASIWSPAFSGSWTTTSMAASATWSPRERSSVSPFLYRCAVTLWVPSAPNLWPSTKRSLATLLPSTSQSIQCSWSVGAQPAGSIVTGASTIVTFWELFSAKPSSCGDLRSIQPVLSVVTGCFSSPRYTYATTSIPPAWSMSLWPDQNPDPMSTRSVELRSPVAPNQYSLSLAFHRHPYLTRRPG